MTIIHYSSSTIQAMHDSLKSTKFLHNCDIAFIHVLKGNQTDLPPLGPKELTDQLTLGGQFFRFCKVSRGQKTKVFH